MEKCLVTKLQAVVNNENLEYLPTSFVASGDIVQGTEKRIGSIPKANTDNVSNIKRIVVRIDAPANVIAGATLLGNSGESFIRDTTQSGSPNKVFEPNVDYDMVNSPSSYFSSPGAAINFYVSAARAIGSGTITCTMLIYYN